MTNLSRKLYPPTQGGWKKHPANPVLGSAALGTCFDPLVIPEDAGGGPGDTSGGFTMYFSWRPHKSLAVSRSRDGVRWSLPKIILRPNPTSGWEDDINRNAVVKKDGVLHLWYTAFTTGAATAG